MTSFGVLSTGYRKKTLAEIIDEMDTSIKDSLGSQVNTQADSVLGQLMRIFAAQDAEGWDVSEEVYNSQYPDSAAGAALDAVASITGVTRLPATESTVTLTVTGTATTNLPLGRQARVPNGGTFETLAAVTINAATAWAPTTAYSTGDIVTNDTPDRIYVVTVAGTSAGSGGPTGTGTAITDGSVTWRYLGDGDGFNMVAAEATVTGPVVAQAFQVTEIVTPVSGWDGVNNQNDADLGRDLETDAALRVRREQVLATGGKATVDAIRAAVLQVTGVNQALVFENTTLVTDSSGVPGKAFETVVQGGTDVGIAEAIFDTKPAGIQAFGNDISELVVDSQGTSHLIEASRATPVEMFVDVTVVTDGNFPVDGVAQIQQAITDLGDSLQIGDDVIYVLFQCAPLEIAGVVDISVFELDKRPVTVTSSNTENFNLNDGETLTVKVDGESAAQTVTFNTADFVDINNATAAEVAAVISTDLTGATGGTSAGAVTITSDSGGTIEVTGGTANTELAFPTTFDPSGTSNVVIANRQLAVFDSTRISVTVT